MPAPSKQQFGPLAGVKVLDLTMYMAGPTCGLMLADLGADVIKLEKIPGGDDARRLTPPTIGGHAASFMVMNRNKRGIAVDLKKPEGVRILKRLVRSADILIENFRPGTLEKLGVGYDVLAKENPALVFGSITGFGSTGPLSGRGGLDLIAQGFSGLMSITGEGPGRPPVKVGAPVSDTTSGMLLALGVVSAYVNRLKTGKGQFVETSLIEAAISHTYWQAAIFLATGESSGPMGSAHPLTSPYQAYKCSDGYMVLGAPNQINWARLCNAIGASDLIEKKEFVDLPSRRRNNEDLTAALEAVMGKHTRAHWIEKLEVVGVPCGAVNSIAEAFTHPHTIARDMVVDIGDEKSGPVKTVGCPIKLSRTNSKVASLAPHLGEHTREVLLEAGMDDKEIAELKASGAIHCPN